MNELQLRRLLHEALPAPPGAALRCDLWPDVLNRLNRPAPRPARLDWALAALAAAWLALFPQTFRALLTHL